MGADKSDNAISRELFQLDLATQSIQDNCGSTGDTSHVPLDLARLSYLPHNHLTHYLVLSVNQITKLDFCNTTSLFKLRRKS